MQRHLSKKVNRVPESVEPRAWLPQAGCRFGTNQTVVMTVPAT
jgi:hypothetical protein